MSNILYWLNEKFIRYSETQRMIIIGTIIFITLYAVVLLLSAILSAKDFLLADIIIKVLVTLQICIQKIISVVVGVLILLIGFIAGYPDEYPTDTHSELDEEKKEVAVLIMNDKNTTYRIVDINDKEAINNSTYMVVLYNTTDLEGEGFDKIFDIQHTTLMLNTDHLLEHSIPHNK